MDLFRYIDSYCERTSPGIFAEPLNLFTNAAFLLAAWLAYRRLRREDSRPLPFEFKILFGAAYAIGIGSGLFHALANAWSMWADVLPIMFFLLFYLGVYLRRMCRYTWKETAIGFGLFLGVTAFFAVLIPKSMVNDSQNYFGACIALFVMYPFASRRGLKGARLFALAGLTFAVSLTFRSIDQGFCPGWPLGTHFLWHSLNGVVIYLALRVAVDNSGRFFPLESPP